VVRLSILIPAIGDQQTLDETVLSVLENRPADCELLLVHRPEYRDPYALADEVRFVQTSGGRTPLGMLLDGVQAARAELIHWLQPGCHATYDAVQAATDCFQDPSVALVSPVIADHARPERQLISGVWYDRCGRRRLCGEELPVNGGRRMTWPRCAGPTLVAGIAHRSRIPRAHLWNEHLGAWADVDLALAVAASPRRSIPSIDCALTADRASIAGWLWPHASPRDDACQAEEFFWRHRSDGHLTAHAWHLARQILSGMARGKLGSELSGRWCGYRSGRRPEPPGAAKREMAIRMDDAHCLSSPNHQLASTSPVVPLR
jgi:hypothetical protein